MDRLSDYDYELPPELIAAQPAPRRADARLLVLERTGEAISHRYVRDLPELLSPGDCLVLNDTRVLPARLLGRRVSTGGRWEGLFLGRTDEGIWRLIGQTRGRLRSGEEIAVFPPGAPDDEALLLTMLECSPGGEWHAVPQSDEETLDLLQRYGTLPLPPYIGRHVATEVDRERYQTVFARLPGAVAAPTAGLHFTPELLSECRRQGISDAYVTLHVGIGTFRPIKVEDLAEHHMHAEWCELTAETAATLEGVRAAGGRIVAVGTTTVRTVETACRHGRFEAFRGETDLFIRPPYEFRGVDALLTNFHLPKSSLLVLVSAFAGVDAVRDAYRTAVREHYRFYSYGDAMLIL